MEKYYWCGICGGKAASGTVACSKCRYCVHLKYTKVTFKEAKKLGRKFIRYGLFLFILRTKIVLLN